MSTPSLSLELTKHLATESTRQHLCSLENSIRNLQDENKSLKEEINQYKSMDPELNKKLLNENKSLRDELVKLSSFSKESNEYFHNQEIEETYNRNIQEMCKLREEDKNAYEYMIINIRNQKDQLADKILTLEDKCKRLQYENDELIKNRIVDLQKVITQVEKEPKEIKKKKSISKPTSSKDIKPSTSKSKDGIHKKT